MALAASPCVNAGRCVSGTCMCVCFVVVFLEAITWVFFNSTFVHEKISICVNARHSKVEDGADSLCAVYYRILCNYIITANHPPEVA